MALVEAQEAPRSSIRVENRAFGGLRPPRLAVPWCLEALEATGDVVNHAFGSLKSTDFRAVPYACRWGVFHQELNRKGILSTAGPKGPRRPTLNRQISVQCPMRAVVEFFTKSSIVREY